MTGRAAREPTRQKAPIRPRNWRSEGMPRVAWGNGERDQLLVCRFPRWPERGIGSESANTLAATTRVSSDAVISCSNHEAAAWRPSFVAAPRLLLAELDD